MVGKGFLEVVTDSLVLKIKWLGWCRSILYHLLSFSDKRTVKIYVCFILVFFFSIHRQVDRYIDMVIIMIIQIYIGL